MLACTRGIEFFFGARERELGEDTTPQNPHNGHQNFLFFTPAYGDGWEKYTTSTERWRNEKESFVCRHHNDEIWTAFARQAFSHRTIIRSIFTPQIISRACLRDGIAFEICIACRCRLTHVGKTLPWPPRHREFPTATP